MTDHRPRIAIVGGGLAGLCAAAAAAHKGAVPTVFEGANDIGGRARTRSEGDFRFNLGPHALYPRAARVLRDLGVEIPGRTPRLSGLALRDGRLHRLPASPWSLLQTRLLNPLDKAEFGRVLAGMRRAPGDDWHDRTVRDWVEQATARPGLRALLFALMRLATYTNAPDQLSAGAALAQFAEATGVLYVDGGWETLTDRLQERISANGGTIARGTRVTAVRPAASGIEVSTRDGGQTFDAAVVTGSAQDVVEVLGPFASPALRRAAERAMPVKATVLDIALRTLPRPRRTFGLGIDQPLYLSVHSATARGLAPAGAATLNLARYTPVAERVEAAAAEAQLAGWADAVQPGWQEQAEARALFPDLTVMNDFPRAADGGLRGRPDVDASGIPGVFVAGDWVGPVGLLSDAATTSGAAAGTAAAATIRRHDALGVA